MQTIHLDANMVPATLRGSYTGKKFKARVVEQVTIPSDAGIWGGGSRDTYQVIRLDDGATVDAVNHNAAPWNSSRHDIEVKLQPGIAVVMHTIFCGKDMGLTFYVHPENAAKLLPAPTSELTEIELIVLAATASYKSHYNGQDRYQMAQRDAEYCRDGKIHIGNRSVNYSGTFPTRDQWAMAQQMLTNLKLLNKAGAITPAGRNAIA